MKKAVSLVLSVALVICLCNTNAFALSKVQEDRADKLAKICIANWEKYGVLPSVCIGQAMEETGLGTAYNNGNLWGICSGRVSYSSIEDGCMAYLKVINNKNYYPDASFKEDYREQLKNILYDKDGNEVYCQPANNYYSDVTWMIEHYGWDKYDRKLFRGLEKQKLKESRQKKQGQIFRVVFDSNVPVNEAWVSDKVSEQNGTVQIKSIDEMEYFDIYDLRTKDIPEREIHVNNTSCKDVMVRLNFNKGAKG